MSVNHVGIYYKMSVKKYHNPVFFYCVLFYANIYVFNLNHAPNYLRDFQPYFRMRDHFIFIMSSNKHQVISQDSMANQSSVNLCFCCR